MNIAICIVAYNRLHALKRVLASLAVAGYGSDPVTLVVSIDKSDVCSVEKYAREFDWKYGEKRVVTHPENLGLKKHILGCGELLEKFDALILLEDDLVVAPGFYQYARQCVDRYRDDDRIAGISLYGFSVNYQNRLPFVPLKKNGSDVYFMNCAQSWGQVWMRNQWKTFTEWYALQNESFGASSRLPRSICSWPESSWLKYHTKYCIEQDKYFVYPYTSLSTNSGDAGTHNRSGAADLYQVPLPAGTGDDFRLPELRDDSIRYDGFFEYKGYAFLCERLGIAESELCVDFYGERRDAGSFRYWLTRETAGYEVIESYALQMRPYEMNIFLQNRGTDLYLYDRSRPCISAKEDKKANRRFLAYLYQITLSDYLKRIVLKSTFGKILQKIYKLLK